MLKILALLGMMASTSFASTITYTLTATAGGFIDGVNFTSSLLTITAVASSSAPGAPFSSIIQVGTTSDSFNDFDSYVFVNHGPCSSPPFPPGSACVGFGIFEGGDLLDIANNGFSTYVLGDSIGPLTDSAPFFSGAFFPTDSGVLSIHSAIDASFQATVVGSIPEPATILLLLPSFVCAILLRRRHGPKSSA